MAVLMAAAAVAIAVIAVSDQGDGGPAPIDASDVREQIEGIRELIQENLR